MMNANALKDIKSEDYENRFVSEFAGFSYL